MMVVWRTSPLSLWRFSGGKEKWMNYVWKQSKMTSSLLCNKMVSSCTLLLSEVHWSNVCILYGQWYKYLCLLRLLQLLLPHCIPVCLVQDSSVCRGLASSHLPRGIHHCVVYSTSLLQTSRKLLLLSLYLQLITLMHWQPCAVASLLHSVTLYPSYAYLKDVISFTWCKSKVTVMRVKFH